jgi:hypothetical protein
MKRILSILAVVAFSAVLSYAEKPLTPIINPAIPVAGQSVGATQSHQATISWTNPNGAGTITVLRAASCSGTFASVATSVAFAGPYSDTTVSAGQTYAYEVEAVVNGSTSSPSACTTSSTGTIPVFPVGSLSVAQGTSATQAIATWTASADSGTTVTLERGTGACGSTGQTFSVLTSSGAAAGSYTDNTVTAGTTYCYEAFAGIGAVESASTTFQFSSSVAAPSSVTVVVQ